MRYAILSDIHANKRAWDVFLADIADQSIDSVICLGDVIGYGPMPQAVLDGVRETCAAIVLGNHDAAVCGRLDTSIFNDHAREVIEWTRGRLDEFDIDFLLEVPLAVEGGEDILFVHAEAIEPGRFDYVTTEEVAAANFEGCGHRLIFCGHTHRPCVFALNGNGVSTIEEGEIQLEAGMRYLINVGSAGEPREADDLRGRYVIYDSDRETLSYRALEFDIEAYREDLRREGLGIKPFFLRAADFMNGVRTQPLVPELHAMSRRPVVPASKTGNASSGLVLPPKVRPMAPPGSDVPGYDPTALGVSTPKVIEVGKRQASPALIVSVMLVTVLLAGAVYMIWPVLSGGNANTVADAAEPARVEESRGSKGKKVLLASKSTKTADAAKPLPTTSATVSSPAPVPKSPATAGPDGLPPVSKKLPVSEPVTKAGKLKEGVFAILLGTKNFNVKQGPYKVNPAKKGKPKLVKGKIGHTASFSPGAGLVYGKKADHVVSGKGMSISFWYHPNNPQKQVKHVVGTASPGKILETGGWSVYSGLDALGLIVGDGAHAARVESHLGHSGKVVPWRHVVAVIDLKSKRARLYKNGSHAGEVDLSALSGTIPAPHPLAFGADPEGQGKFHYWGHIDEVAIWKRPLSADEVAGIHRAAVKNKGIFGIVGL